MRRLLLAFLAVFIAGCAQTSLRPPDAPGPQSNELEVLSRMIGSWVGTAEFVSPTPAEMLATMKEQMPDYEGEMPTSFRGESRFQWALGGHFLRSEGWHEEGPGVKAHYTEFVTWDPAAGKFHAWYYSDKGETGEGWWTFDAATDTFHITWKGMKNGKPSSGKGFMRFPNANTMAWEWEGTDPDMGEMKMRGTSHRS